jgi:hypothetical protein
MTEEQARARINELFTKYVEPHLPGSEFDYVDLINDKPMDLEAAVRGHDVLVSIIERSPDDTTPCRYIAGRQPESVAVGEFYALITLDPDELGYDKAIAMTKAISEPGVFVRLSGDNIEFEPAEFVRVLKAQQADTE